LDLERFVADEAQKIISIATVRFSGLVNDDIISVMEKVGYFQKKGILKRVVSKD